MTDTKPNVLPRECFGIVVTTPTIAETLAADTLANLLNRHFANDWGELCSEDKQVNADACAGGGGRIMSVYSCPETSKKIWIMSYIETDPERQQIADCCNTTVLFPDEY